MVEQGWTDYPLDSGVIHILPFTVAPWDIVLYWTLDALVVMALVVVAVALYWLCVYLRNDIHWSDEIRRRGNE